MRTCRDQSVPLERRAIDSASERIADENLKRSRASPFVISFVLADVCANRTRLTALLGALSVAVGTGALLVVLVFTRGFYTFMDHCFFRAKPVIGSVQLTPTSHDLIKSRDLESLEKFAADKCQSITRVSTIDTTELQLWKSKTQRFERLEPKIWSLPSANSDLISPKNGVQFISGKPFGTDPETHDDLRFKVLVNVTYLEQFLEYSESDVRKLLKKDSTVTIPEHVFVHFAPVELETEYGAEKQWFEPGTVAIPISGCFALRETWAPHIVVAFEVAAAYYFQNAQRWHPSYALQFNDKDGTPLTTISNGGPRPLQDSMVTLPTRTNLLACETLADKGLTPFKMVVALVSQYRQPNRRSDFKQQLQIPSPVPQSGDFKFSVEAIQADLREARLTLAVDKLFIEHGITLTNRARLTAPMTNHSCQIKDSGNVYDVELNDGSFAIAAHRPWDAMIPSDTVSESFNRVARVVQFYSDATSWTVFSMVTVSVIIFGLGYIDKKRLDIGILKSCGLDPFRLGVIYTSQVWLIGVIGFLTSLIMFELLLASWMEPQARGILESLTKDFVAESSLMALSADVLLNCAACIFAGVALGTIPPCLRAVTIDPIEDLRTGV